MNRRRIVCCLYGAFLSQLLVGCGGKAVGTTHEDSPYQEEFTLVEEALPQDPHTPDGGFVVDGRPRDEEPIQEDGGDAGLEEFATTDSVGDEESQLDESFGSPDTIPARCGNQILDIEELCDGDVMLCSQLASSWIAGQASCRADCSGYDVSSCERNPLVSNGGDEAANCEVVKPMVRDATRWPWARCNDGSAYGFSVRLAANDSPKWLLFLQGGGYCDGQVVPCKNRSQALFEGLAEPDGAVSQLMYRGGLFARDALINPALWDANHVYLPYCSSDMSTGTRTTKVATDRQDDGWYFSGRFNVEATFDILKQRFGLDDTNPLTQVLFGGGSAGGVGVIMNAEQAFTAFPEATARRQVRLLIDAGWMIDYGNIFLSEQNDGVFGAMEESSQVFLPIYLESCALEQRLAGQHESRCFVGPVAIPHLQAQAPVMVHLAQGDHNVAGMYHVDLSNSSQEAAWQQAVRDSFAQAHWVFSNKNDLHVISMKNIGLEEEVAGITFGDLFAAFWQDALPSQLIE